MRMDAMPLDSEGHIDVEGVFAHSAGFLRTLGPSLVSLDEEQAVLRLDAGPELHNHVGGPHAAALFGQGELAAFALVVKVFRAEVKAGGVPLIKGGSIDYRALVTGPVLATARITDDVAAVRARFEERGSASLDCEVVFRSEDGRETTVMHPRMTLKRF
jgi:acyl-coenzyme A thioesterase PaaI-like protein